MNPKSESKSDSQPQSIQFLLSSTSPIWQITQQLNVELLMNYTQPSQVRCRANLAAGRIIRLYVIPARIIPTALFLCFSRHSKEWMITVCVSAMEVCSDLHWPRVVSECPAVIKTPGVSFCFDAANERDWGLWGDSSPSLFYSLGHKCRRSYLICLPFHLLYLLCLQAAKLVSVATYTYPQRAVSFIILYHVLLLGLINLMESKWQVP